MPRALSNDLRERVVKAIEEGQSCRSAAGRFGVSASAAIRWYARKRERGTVDPSVRGWHIRSPLEDHLKLLLAFVAGEPDLTIDEIRQKLCDRGIRAGRASIWRFYDRHGISFKKKRFCQASRTSRT